MCRLFSKWLIIVWDVIFYALLRQGFSSALLTSGTGALFIVGGRSAHCRMFSSHPGLCPLDASGFPSV